MTEITCTECGYVNKAESRYCDECGFELSGVESKVEFEEEPKSTEENIETVSGIEESKEVVQEQEDINPVVTPQKPPRQPSPNTILDFEPLPEPKDWRKKLSPPTFLESPLAVLIHVETGKRFELPPGEKVLYIGKYNEELTTHVELSDLPNSDIISRVQAAIFVENNEFLLEDAGSLNGTHLNDEELKPGVRFRKLLKNGDKISFGRTRKVHLTFTIEG